MSRKEYLRRYTDLPALVSLLTKKKITLLDPKSWDDRNDSYYFIQYRERNQLKSVLALCFTQSSETYHHWRVFAEGPGGVCIRFVRSKLLKAVKKQIGVRMNTVNYYTLRAIRNNIRGNAIEPSQLPFLKRIAFEDENEFRIIYESKTEQLPSLDINIPLSCISRITLSPWLHPLLYLNLKRTISLIEGCNKLEIVRSTLIDNKQWKNLGKARMPV